MGNNIKKKYYLGYHVLSTAVRIEMATLLKELTFHI